MKILLIASIVVAALFILQSAFRRRLLWSIKVTLGIYAVFFILRLVIWPFIDFEPRIFLVLASLGIVCVVIWMIANWLTDRYVRSRPKQTAPRGEIARAWRALLTKRR